MTTHRNPQRVAFFIPSMDTGGAERVTLNLLQALAEDPDLEVDLVLCHARGGYLDRVPDAVNIVDLDVSRIATSLIPLARWLRSNQPNVLVSALVTANIIAVFASQLARFSGRVVVAEHNDFATALSNAKNRRAQIAPALIRRTYPTADVVIAVSNGVAAGLADSVGIDRSLITVVPNPVITAEVRDKVNGEPEHRWFADTTPVALAVGRLQPQKNFQLLIEAFHRLPPDTDLRLVIHGEGKDRDELQRSIDSKGLSGRVELAGLTSNPYAAMKAARMLVMSSKFEGLPTVLIEALYCGTAIISTDCPSGPDEILANGRYGTLVPMDNADALAAAIQAELDRPHGPNPNEAWEPFTETIVVDRYRDVLGL